VTDSASLDLVRSIYADWERGTWTGAHGMAAGFRDWVNAWHGYYTEADDYREPDDDRVLVLNHSGGRGRASGLDLGEMRAEGATLFHVRDGEVIRLVAYWDRERALADLGLAPEGDSADAPD
jgi:ketosteroid isomerase-like protein